MAESQQISKQEEKQLKKAAKKASRQGRYKRLWQDFKAFISKGNVLDMAVGVIAGQISVIEPQHALQVKSRAEVLFDVGTVHLGISVG